MEFYNYSMHRCKMSQISCAKKNFHYITLPLNTIEKLFNIPDESFSSFFYLVRQLIKITEIRIIHQITLSYRILSFYC